MISRHQGLQIKKSFGNRKKLAEYENVGETKEHKSQQRSK